MNLETLASKFLKGLDADYTLRSDAPDWVRAVSRDFDPDQITRQALGTAAELIESGYDEPEEPDAYMSDLLGWLNDYDESVQYVDAELAGGRHRDFFRLLQAAQGAFFQYIFETLTQALEEHEDEADEEEAEEEEEEDE